MNEFPVFLLVASTAIFDQPASFAKIHYLGHLKEFRLHAVTWGPATNILLHYCYLQHIRSGLHDLLEVNSQMIKINTEDILDLEFETQKISEK